MKKKIGLLISSLLVSKQVEDLIELSKSSLNYEITTLIINKPKETKKTIVGKITSYIRRRGIKKFISNVFFISVCKFEKILMKRYKKFSNFYDTYKLSQEKYQIIILEPLISKSKIVYKYSKSDIEKIKNSNLDLIVRCCVGILRGEILDACPNGIISFHHGDNDIYRGGPAGFWEVFNRNPRTGFIIQRLKEELDGGDVLYKGFINTKWFYSLNLATLYEVSNPYLHKVIDDITSNSRKFYAQKKSPYSFPLYTNPNLYESLEYVFRTSIKFIIKKFDKIIGKSHKWGIAYQFVDDWQDVTIRHSIKIANPKNRFLADPFVIKRSGKHYCFVEDYNHKINKGKISVYEITENGYKELGVALKEDFHLSFPFLFEYENQLFMCPETHEKNEIRIYKCTEFPLRWVFHKTIMSNISAADTVIFKYQHLWWLLTTIDRSEIKDHSCQLHIFHSSNPLNDKWVPHSKNPVIFDSLIARNGGLIIDDNNIYRVFQRQGFDMYGKGLGVAKINTLKRDEFDEEILFEVESKFFKNIEGSHTFNFNNGLFVIDYVKIN